MLTKPCKSHTQVGVARTQFLQYYCLPGDDISDVSLETEVEGT